MNQTRGNILAILKRALNHARSPQEAMSIQYEINRLERINNEPNHGIIKCPSCGRAFKLNSNPHK